MFAAVLPAVATASSIYFMEATTEVDNSDPFNSSVPPPRGRSLPPPPRPFVPICRSLTCGRGLCGTFPGLRSVHTRVYAGGRFKRTCPARVPLCTALPQLNRRVLFLFLICQ